MATTTCDHTPTTTDIPAAEEADQFIDTETLLKRIPVSPKTLQNWRERGIIPYVQPVPGGRIVYDWQLVREALRRKGKSAAR